MTILKFEKQTFLSSSFNGESTLPSISTTLSLFNLSTDLFLSEKDGLFMKYGEVEYAYPYKCLDNYNRDLKPTEYDVAILENDYIKATFLPYFGGKLHSLFDKKEGKELLFSNPVIRPCNLGVRNAWMSGGIEWNFGYRGHNPFTCSLINTAKTQLDDGTPVLRFFYYERVRCCVVQIDFFLPENSKYLFNRVRITNPNPEVTPVYWWSNVAAKEKKGDRVIVPATESYTAPEAKIWKVEIPYLKGIDVTYPYNNIFSNDWFWDANKSPRHYIAQLDKDGYGLSQTSTSLLQGRKLFVWGNSSGGKKWCNFLTKDDEDGRYDEIQCGLARTQYECLPMPPHTVWEFLEAYGPMKEEKKLIHGDFEIAKKTVESSFDKVLPQDYLENLLQNTEKMAKSPAEMVFAMEDYGALEVATFEKNNLMNPQLDFGQVTSNMNCWIRLFKEGTIGEHDPNDIPESYVLNKRWEDLLLNSIKGKDKRNWYAYYLLGTMFSAKLDFENAKKFYNKSLSLKENAWSNYCLGIIARRFNKKTLEYKYMTKALSERKDDVSLNKEVFRSLHTLKKSSDIISLYENASKDIKENNRIKLYYAYALARLDRINEAEIILCGKDGNTILVVPDIRECEMTITDLWFYIQKKKGIKNVKKLEPPYDLDFRMFSKRKEFFKKYDK